MFQNLNPLAKSTAVAEIFLLMFVSFVLGYLLRHLICKAKNDQEKSASAKNDSPKNIVQKIDDLKVVEGIGPAIEKILNNNKIFSYDDLAKTNVEVLKEMLMKSGPFFQNHNPSSWGEQARLLRDGKTEEFKKLTNVLVAGVKVK